MTKSSILSLICIVYSIFCSIASAQNSSDEVKPLETPPPSLSESLSEKPATQAIEPTAKKNTANDIENAVKPTNTADIADATDTKPIAESTKEIKIGESPEKWFLGTAGKVSGPFTAEEIREKLNQKIIRSDTKAAKEGTDEWIPVHNVLNPPDTKNDTLSDEAGPAETKEWYVSQNGAAAGPFTRSQIKNMIGKKEITAKTDINKVGTDNWVKAQTVFTEFGVLQSDMVDSDEVWEYKRSPEAREKLMHIGVSLIASGAALVVGSLLCVARGDAPEGEEWALDNGTCAGVLLSSGAITGLIGIPFIAGARAKHRPDAINMSANPKGFGLTYTRRF